MGASVGVPASITTPDSAPSRLGTLEFDDGAPARDTAERLYDHVNFMRGCGGKGWFLILRLDSPLQTFFDKTWRPSEIEPHSSGSNGHPGRNGDAEARWPGEL